MTAGDVVVEYTMTCECGHSDKDHERRTYASGQVKQKCRALGVERRPMAPKSMVTGLHWICPCEKIIPSVYLVMTHDRRTNETYVNKEFSTRKEAEKHVDTLYAWCDEIWCENHKNWIEER